MMGRAHALSGYIAGTLYAEALFAAPWDVRLIAATVVAGGALLPDLDQVSSTASRALGILTQTLARGIAWVSIEIYHATRLPRDPSERQSGHRLITHTPVGAVSFGVLAALACLITPYAGAVVIGLMVALGVSAVPGMRNAVEANLPGGGLAVFAISGGGGWWMLTHQSGWWWTVPVAVTLGAQIHREGDWCTKGGVPRRSWPRANDGRRWDKVRSPIWWRAGDDVEVLWVTPALGLAALASTAWASGAITWVITLWAARNG